MTRWRSEAASSPSSDPRIHVDLARLRLQSRHARRLSLLPRQPSRSVLNGRHASRLRGRGLNFEELRQYAQGDDVRTLDWKVTARTGKPHVRVYTEERDRPALLLVDQRMTMFFGSQVFTKSVIAAEAAALSAQCLLAQGDRVGGLVVSETAIAEHRPLRSPKTLDQLLSSIARANQGLHADQRAGDTAPLTPLLNQAARIAKTGYLILIFSDFAGLDATAERPLRSMAANNDMILFSVSDPLADSLPRGLVLTGSDGKNQAHFDLTSEAAFGQVQAFVQERLAILCGWSGKYGFPIVPLTTDRSAADQMLRQFGHPGPAV